MRFAFTEEHRLFRDSVRDMLAQQCKPDAVRRAWSTRSGRVEGLWARLAELGILGLTVPEAHGGLGLGELDLVLILEEMGRAAVPEPFADTIAVGVPLLRDLGGPMAERWLSKVAAGEASIGVGVDGVPFVANATEASLLLLERRGDLHAVDDGHIVYAAHPSVDGARRLWAVNFAEEPATIVARGGDAKRLIADAFDRGALAAAAELVGLAQRMIDLTVEYTKVRQQFGKPIGSFQAVKHHLADALIALEFARPVVYRAAYALAHLEPNRSLDVSMAKARASDAARLVAKKALQCHGAIGYTVECDLHMWMKRAWALSSSWGDAAFHRARVGTFLFDQRLDVWSR